MSNFKSRIELDIEGLSDDGLVAWSSFAWGRIIELYDDLGAMQETFNRCLIEARNRGITERIDQGFVNPK